MPVSCPAAAGPGLPVRGTDGDADLVFVALAWLFRLSQVHYRIRRLHRRMPRCRAWLCPAQRHGWHMVSLGKLGAWLLLMVIGYVMVSVLHRRAAVTRGGR